MSSDQPPQSTAIVTTARERHIEHHERLHGALDELIADYMQHNKGKRPSNTTVTELMQWSHQQCLNPTEI